MTAKYEAVREMKWVLDRLVNALNAEDPHLAACAVWDIAGTLVITLQQAKNPNPHIGELAQFLHENWR